jgi:hypothetical protein
VIGGHLTLRGEIGVVKNEVARNLRPVRQSIEVRWSTSGRLVKLPIEARKRELLIMRESKRKPHGQANAKITGHVALMPPSGVVTVTIRPADQSVYRKKSTEQHPPAKRVLFNRLSKKKKHRN